MKIQRGYVTTKSHAWIGHYSKWIVDPTTGEKRRKQESEKVGEVQTMTKTQAKVALQKVMARELGITQDARLTLSGFITQRWMGLYEGGWRPSTTATNKQQLKLITDRFGDEPLEDIDKVALQTWLNALAKTRSGSVVRHVRIFLKSIFEEAYQQKYLPESPARLLKVPKLRPAKQPFLVMEQIQALIAASMPFGIRTSESAFLQTALATGMRPSEQFALRWSCVDLSKGTLRLVDTVYRGKMRSYGKTSETQDETLLLPEAAVQALTEMHAATTRNEPDDFIWATSVGSVWLKENYLRRRLQPIAEAAKIPHLNYQMLRRSCATWAGVHGGLKSAQAILRNKRAEVTANHYMQVISTDVRDTVNEMSAEMFKAPAQAEN